MSGGPQIGAETDAIERWWVVFRDSERFCWWNVFTRPGFGHCWAFRSLTPEAVLLLNPLVHRVEQAVVFRPASEVLEGAFAAGFRVLVAERHVRVYDPARDGRVGRGLFVNCASIIAYTIGVSFSWRSTPWQLWKALKRAGAVEIRNGRCQSAVQGPPETQARQVC